MTNQELNFAANSFVMLLIVSYSEAVLSGDSKTAEAVADLSNSVDRFLEQLRDAEVLQ